MSENDLRMSKIEQLAFLVKTEEEKELALAAAEEIFAAESDEQACKIAEKYRKKLYPCLMANIVDVIAIVLKGGHILKYVPDLKDISYLVFIPVPAPPKQKTLVGHITKKQFHELFDKGIISERIHMQHTDSRGFHYSYYQLAEEIFHSIRGEAANQQNAPISPCKFIYDFDAAMVFKSELEKEAPGITKKLSVVELDKLIDYVHNHTLMEAFGG